jgi:hypothetical protein
VAGAVCRSAGKAYVSAVIAQKYEHISVEVLIGPKQRALIELLFTLLIIHDAALQHILSVGIFTD